MNEAKDINRLKQNPDAARSLAQVLASLSEVGWTDWERDFLENMGSWKDELHTRQAEKLLELERASVRTKSYKGMEVRPLVDNCLLGIDELYDAGDDRSIEFLQSLKSKSYPPLTNRQWRWLERIAAQTFVIDPIEDEAPEV